jgi:uncharacterized protein
MAELSINEKLGKIWSLQQIDSQLDEIQILRGELPMEVADLEDELIGLDTRIKKLKAEAKEAEQEVARLNANTKEVDANVKKYIKQLEEVRNDREYEALQKEIELGKLDIQISEKRVKEAKVNLEAKRERLTVAEAKQAARQQDLDVKKSELAGIIEKTEKDEQRLLQSSNVARTGVDDRLLKAYDRIRKTYRNGMAVVTIERNSCGGCFNSIPPQVRLEVGLHKKIVACEHCGRIMVDHTIAYPSAAADA